MQEVSGRQRVSIAKVLMEQFSTGDWSELFQLTDADDFTNSNSRFFQDVHWQNEGLKQGCINAVNYILDSNPDYLKDIIEFEGVSNCLERKFNSDFKVIESILNDDEGKIVQNPDLSNSNESVFHALADAETLITERGAPNAYDRMHTALHSFLREVCDNNSISYGSGDAITALLPKVNSYIKSQPDDDGRNDKVYQMLRSTNAILDSLNYLRNHHSLSHPTEELLNEADALYAINIARSIMTYVDSVLVK
jgi:hypothetical protein